jgi:quercetin dioxygenase-like cupin family protein
MERVAVPLAAAALLAVAGTVGSAQMPANQEPHHHVALYTNDLRILDVTVAAGEATAEHAHEHDTAAVSLGGAGNAKPAGSVDVAAYTGTPNASRIENTDTKPYHVVEVENMRGHAFTIYDVRFTAAARTASHTHMQPTVLVLIDGAIENSGNGGETPARLEQPGRWLFIARGQSHNLESTGTGDAHVVEIEVR